MDPSSLSRHVDEMVVLTCLKPTDDGNPDCDIYTWNRVEGNDGLSFPTSKILRFKMEESRTGNYTCTCGNNYTTSDVSDMAKVIFLAGPAPTSCRLSFINFLDNTSFLSLEMLHEYHLPTV